MQSSIYDAQGKDQITITEVFGTQRPLAPTEGTFVAWVTLEEYYPTKRLTVDQMEVKFLPELGKILSGVDDDTFQSVIQESGLPEALQALQSGAERIVQKVQLQQASDSLQEKLPTEQTSPEEPTSPSEPSSP